LDGHRMGAAHGTRVRPMNHACIRIHRQFP
jgi:hypothetical protein